jgi:hypothetical protein
VGVSFLFKEKSRQWLNCSEIMMGITEKGAGIAQKAQGAEHAARAVRTAINGSAAAMRG